MASSYIDALTAMLAASAVDSDIVYVGRPGDPDPDRQMTLAELALAILERGVTVESHVTNGICLRLSIGYQICFQRFNLGARDAVGAGTTADPYRTGVATWTFAQAFSGQPRIFISPDCGSGSAAVRALTGTVGSVSTTVAQNVQVVAVSTAAGSDTVFANALAIGPWS